MQERRGFREEEGEGQFDPIEQRPFQSKRREEKATREGKKERRTTTGATRITQRTINSTLLMTLTVKGDRNTLQIRNVFEIRALNAW